VLPFLKKRVKHKGLASVALTSQGVGVARIERVEGRPPRLHGCSFESLADEAEAEAALARLIETHDLDGAPCVALLEPGAHSLLLIEAPDVPAEELRAAVRWRIKDMIDFHVDDAVIDVFEIPGQDAPGRARLMYAVAARASAIQHQVDLLDRLQMQITAIDIPEMALRNVAALLPEDRSGVAQLQIMDEGGLITLTKQSSLFMSRNIDIGMRLLQQAAAQPLDEDGSSPHLERIFDRIVLEIQRSLDYYESHFAQGTIGSLVIAPMCQEIPGMVSFMAANLGITARVLDLNALLDCDEKLSESKQAMCLPAIGAALRNEEKML
jgi:MSHA biogenesis protein MshI